MQCTKCKQSKPNDEFRYREDKQRYVTRCRECERLAFRERYYGDQDEHKARGRRQKARRRAGVANADWRKRCIKFNERAVAAMKRAGYHDKADAIREELRRREQAKKPTKKQVAKSKRDRIRIEKNTKARDIIAQVCLKHEITRRDFMSDERWPHLVKARHEAFYLARSELKMSYPNIAKIMGKKDHTTILHGVKKHAERTGLPVPDGHIYFQRMKESFGEART